MPDNDSGNRPPVTNNASAGMIFGVMPALALLNIQSRQATGSFSFSFLREDFFASAARFNSISKSERTFM